jgi:hypothetical protein
MTTILVSILPPFIAYCTYPYVFDSINKEWIASRPNVNLNEDLQIFSSSEELESGAEDLNKSRSVSSPNSQRMV